MPEQTLFSKSSPLIRGAPKDPPRTFEVIRRPAQAQYDLGGETPPQPFNEINAERAFKAALLPSKSRQLVRPQRPYDDYPPTFIPCRRWWVLTVFRVAVLALNAFMRNFYLYLIKVERSKAEDAYWVRVVCAFSAVYITWVADHTRSSRSAVAVVRVVAGLCVALLGFVPNSVMVVFVRIVIGIGQAAVVVLSVSMISDMLPWPSVFVGVSGLCICPFLGYVVDDVITELPVVATSRGWKYATVITGILLNQDDVYAMIELRAWTNIKATIRHMALLRTLWLLILSTTLTITSTTLYNHLLIYLEQTYRFQSDLLVSIRLILTTAGSVSVLSGSIMSCFIYRFSHHRQWRLVSLWSTAISLALSMRFALVAVLSRELDSGGAELSVLKGALGTSLMFSEFGVGALSTIIISVLPPRCKTFAFAICSSIRSGVSAVVVELVSIGLRHEIPFRPSFKDILEIHLATIVPTCYVLAVADICAAARLTRVDMEDVDVLKKPMSSWLGPQYGLLPTLLSCEIIRLESHLTIEVTTQVELNKSAKHQATLGLGVNEVASSLLIAKHVGSAFSRTDDGRLFHTLESPFGVGICFVPACAQHNDCQDLFAALAMDVGPLTGHTNLQRRQNALMNAISEILGGATMAEGQECQSNGDTRKVLDYREIGSAYIIQWTSRRPTLPWRRGRMEWIVRSTS
ncbi:hypothetical protein K458DRAFT_389740 [Lentithecium fluviatile CBS 122367]|uniref:MFS general substrate transporter n=1 Tax=Lentithecium fluviatile CBS 122367 TaxID=1168545 RepID=A0A6G1J0E5_9PLEO|nr:hypothetical protein K458DRAFT_389740 [Lentithecium fluviatile CBS 122367]